MAWTFGKGKKVLRHEQPPYLLDSWWLSSWLLFLESPCQRTSTRTSKLFLGSAYSNGCWVSADIAFAPRWLCCSQGRMADPPLGGHVACFASCSHPDSHRPPIVSCPFHFSTSYLCYFWWQRSWLFHAFYVQATVYAANMAGLWLWYVRSRFGIPENTYFYYRSLEFPAWAMCHRESCNASASYSCFNGVCMWGVWLKEWKKKTHPKF